MLHTGAGYGTLDKHSFFEIPKRYCYVLFRDEAVRISTQETFSYFKQHERQGDDMKNEKPAMEQSIANLVGENFHQILLDALPCAAFIINTLTHEITASNLAAKKAGVYAGVRNSLSSLWRFTPDKFNELNEYHCEVEIAGVVWSACWKRLPNDSCLCHAVDVTEHHTTDSILKSTIKKLDGYRTIFLRMPEPSYIATPEGIIVDINDAAADQFGYARAELIGQPVAQIYDIETLVFADLSSDILHPSEEMCKEEVVIKTKDNRRRTVLLSMHPVCGEDRMVLHTVSFVNDITREKHQELHQQRLQKNELLGYIASGIAHNFNSLFKGIAGFVELAAARTDDKQVQKYCSKAIQTIERAKSLSFDLLSYSREGTPQKSIQQVLPIVKEKASATGKEQVVEISCEAPDNLWPCACDKYQIGRVIESMVTNAIEAMPKGGRIVIKASNRRFEKNEHTSLESGNYVEISIKDTGVGMQSLMIPHIFDPFYTTKPEARGLGLSMCYSVVSRHGGCIDVNSFPGYGSVFTIYLPAAVSDSGTAIASCLNRCYTKKRSFGELFR